MGDGKSSVGNLLLGKEVFKIGNGPDGVSLNIISQKFGNFEVFDSRGFGEDEKIDIETYQKLIYSFKKEKINAIFFVINGTVCRISEEIKKIIRTICKLFTGKYIWNQIGLIFTHYGYSEEEQLDVKDKEKDYIKKVLEIAEEEYTELIKNQEKDKIHWSHDEKIVNTLKCFYVNAKKKEMENMILILSMR